jgi:hypothetical protein
MGSLRLSSHIPFLASGKFNLMRRSRGGFDVFGQSAVS